MKKTKFIQIRVTRDQYEKIKSNAELKGYFNVSAFLRNLALDNNLNFERKFAEMYDRIVKGGE